MSSMGVRKKVAATHRFGPIGLADRLYDKLLGQDEAINEIVPYIDTFHAGLSPDERPAGIFILLGPTGVGKSHTVETIAKELHGSKSNLLSIHCGEFQMEHEVAKLLGSPAGYLGHKETVPVLNNDTINKNRSSFSQLSLILFDEIEKAASSVMRVLLGMLDKGLVRTGDNNLVKFQDTMIFMTSNLGADDSRKFLKSTFGFSEDRSQEFKDKNLKRISDKALAKKFSPEFINRIDAKISYRSLTKDDVRDIIDREVEVLQELVFTRLGEGGFLIKLTDSAKELVLENGFSEEYGARNIKRYIQKNILQPISALFNAKELKPGQLVTVDSEDGELVLEF